MGPAVFRSRYFSRSRKYSTGTRSRNTHWIATDMRTNVGRKAALRSAGILSQHELNVGGFIRYRALSLSRRFSRHCANFSQRDPPAPSRSRFGYARTSENTAWSIQRGWRFLRRIRAGSAARARAKQYERMEIKRAGDFSVGW